MKKVHFSHLFLSHLNADKHLQQRAIRRPFLLWTSFPRAENAQADFAVRIEIRVEAHRAAAGGDL